MSGKSRRPLTTPLTNGPTAARVPCWSRSAAPRRIPSPTWHGSLAMPSAGQPPAPRCRGDGRLPCQRPVHPGLLDRARPTEGPRAGPRARRCEHPPGRCGALGAGQRVARVLRLAPVVERATRRTSILVQQHYGGSSGRTGRAGRVRGGWRSPGQRPGAVPPGAQSATSSRPSPAASGRMFRSKIDSGILSDTALFGMSTTPPRRPSIGAAPKNRYACSKVHPMAGIR